MFLKNIYFRSIRANFSSTRPKFRLVNLNLVYIQLNLARFELNNKKLYVYLSHFVKFGTWNFPILMEMVFKEDITFWSTQSSGALPFPHDEPA
jgi:hypothetical protein